MVIEKIKELAQLKASLAKMEATVSAQLPAALAELPAQYGYDSLSAFIRALKQAGGAKRKGGKGKAAKAGKAGKKKRAKITDAIKAKVKAAVEAGTSGGAIAKQLGISPASVQNVKKELGLVKSRSAGTPAA